MERLPLEMNESTLPFVGVDALPRTLWVAIDGRESKIFECSTNMAPRFDKVWSGNIDLEE